MCGEICWNRETIEVDKVRSKESWVELGTNKGSPVYIPAADGGHASTTWKDCFAQEEPVADSEVELAVVHTRLGFEGEGGGDPEMLNQNDWKNSEADA